MTRFALLFALSAALLSAQETAPTPAPPPAEQVLSVPEPGRFKRLFQPFRTDTAALSPDGKYLAYTVREDQALAVVVLDIDHPEKMKAHVTVIDDEAATPMLALNQHEKTPARINWMRWTTPTRLTLETNRVFARTAQGSGDWQSWRGAVVAFDADGANAKTLVTPDDLVEFSGENTSGENSFSIRRESGAAFNSRVTTPDMPTPPAGGTTTDSPSADTGPSLLSPDEPTPDAPAAVAATQPRSLRIFDLDPKNPGAVTLIASGAPRAAGSRSVGLYTLDTVTGKLSELTDDLVLNTRTTLLDRQGHVRLTIPNSLRADFPLRYEYLGAKGEKRSQPLDTYSGLTGFSVSPDNYFGARAIPLGFDENPDLLYYAANTGRDTYGIYSLNLATKQRGSLAMENPAYDLIGPPGAGFPDPGSLVFDRFTHRLAGVRYDNAFRTTAWTRPDLSGLQAEFEKRFAGRSIEITDWDEAGRRFLFSTEGPADPGAFFLYDREKNQLMEFVRRAPWVDANHTHLTLPFSYATKDGARISGLVTVPQQPRLKPIPMVVLCPDLPWQRVHTDFQTEVQALADMGFVVVQLNGRGAWGLGLKQRTSLTTGYDLVQAEDIAATVDGLGKVFNVNPHRVALFGRGHGGFIALRALQLYPDKFRCAIALDAPVNLADSLAEQRWTDDDVQPHLMRAWLGDEARLKAAPLTSHPEAVTKPVLLLNYPGPDGTPHRTSYVASRRFGEKVAAHGATVVFGDLNTDYMNGLPAARAAVFDRIEEFLNVNVYDFKVKLQELKVLPNP